MSTDIERLSSVMVDWPADSPPEVARRCEAADALAALGPAATAAVPALLRTLVVPVTVDCALALRVAAAIALWKIAHDCTLTVPILAWALKDEYWGVAPRAVETLAEMGHPGVVPDLIRLAKRRLSHGPFDFENYPGVLDNDNPRPLLAAVADALGNCARGQWKGPSYSSEARALLIELVDFDDDRVRSAARKALATLENRL